VGRQLLKQHFVLFNTETHPFVESQTVTYNQFGKFYKEKESVLCIYSTVREFLQKLKTIKYFSNFIQCDCVIDFN